MKITTTKILELLRQNGYKITPQRRHIIHAIALSHECLTPTALYERIHKSHPDIGLVTIYRTLDILTKLGLTCEIHNEGNHSYLLREHSDHHHHLLCSDCGAVIGFTGCDLTSLEHKISKETGFSINGHLLEFSGSCPDCRRKSHVV
jgi:Fur family transcriptional regulator, ferric uptake regulator